MSIDLQEQADGTILKIRLTGKLIKDDYDRFVPEIDRLIAQHGKVRILMEMHDFHGETARAMWEDFKFGLRHYRDIDRIALVGERWWQHSMAVFCRPFTTAAVRYFDTTKVEEAEAWIHADKPA